MPNATASLNQERIDLKSCPGGFVNLRTMNFGEWQQRQDIVMSVSLQMADRGRQNTANVTMNNEVVTLFEFQRCIVDHNLEDANSRKLNFQNRADLSMLDAKIGNEISSLIQKRHEWAEEDQENFTER